MRISAAHEPRLTFQEKLLWNDRRQNSMSIGCAGCPELKICGGLHVEGGVFDCNTLCSCDDPLQCDSVCRRKPENFIERYLEVDGFSLDNIPRARERAHPTLPLLVPIIKNNHKRLALLATDFVCASLYDAIGQVSGKNGRYPRQSLSDLYGVHQTTRFILTGVDRDARLESWWALPDRRKALKSLRSFNLAAVTTPNFSVFTNVPRPDNLHSMKRIAVSWYEIMDAGIPAALHLNARTEMDYDRWTNFIGRHPELSFVAFEFGTGAGFKKRIDWHLEQLGALGKNCGGKLTLLIRGGSTRVAEIKKSFAHIVILDSHTYHRSIYRRRAVISDEGFLSWAASPTGPNEPLDELFTHNLRSINEWVKLGCNVRPSCTTRRLTENTHGEPRQMRLMLEIPGPAETGAVASHL